MKNRQLDETLRVFEHAGLVPVVRQGRKHLKVSYAPGLNAVLASTPSDGARGTLQARAVARRLVRKLNEPMVGVAPPSVDSSHPKPPPKPPSIVEAQRAQQEREKDERRQRNIALRAAKEAEKRARRAAANPRVAVSQTHGALQHRDKHAAEERRLAKLRNKEERDARQKLEAEQALAAHLHSIFLEDFTNYRRTLKRRIGLCHLKLAGFRGGCTALPGMNVTHRERDLFIHGCVVKGIRLNIIQAHAYMAAVADDTDKHLYMHAAEYHSTVKQFVDILDEFVTWQSQFPDQPAEAAPPLPTRPAGLSGTLQYLWKDEPPIGAKESIT